LQLEQQLLQQELASTGLSSMENNFSSSSPFFGQTLYQKVLQQLQL
jgi:hypothetical protein